MLALYGFPSDDARQKGLKKWRDEVGKEKAEPMRK
jgi:hypothetical protein